MKRGIRIDPADNVGIVLEHVKPGDELSIDGLLITAKEAIDLPHKIALTDIAEGENVIKYGSVIGYATQPIEKGQHVHVHNVDSEKMMK